MKRKHNGIAAEILREMESILFYYGFKECCNDSNINYLKINNTTYLLFKIYGSTIDLIQAEYINGATPCTSDPFTGKLLIPSFNPLNKNNLTDIDIKIRALLNK